MRFALLMQGVTLPFIFISCISSSEAFLHFLPVILKLCFWSLWQNQISVTYVFTLFLCTLFVKGILWSKWSVKGSEGRWVIVNNNTQHLQL